MQIWYCEQSSQYGDDHCVSGFFSNREAAQASCDFLNEDMPLEGEAGGDYRWRVAGPCEVMDSFKPE